MKKTLTKMLALGLVAVFALSSCAPKEKIPPTKVGASGTEKPGTKASVSQPLTAAKPINNLVYPRLQTEELATFNILYSQAAADFQALTNLVDTLLEVDKYGTPVASIAKEWGTTDGGKTWTFKLREGVKWVDMNANVKADVVADDWATGLEWVLNFHKNANANTSMPSEMIVGAAEYYAYTKGLEAPEAEALNAGAGSKFRDMVGIETPDALTIIYHCTTEKPYFDTVATYACLYPMAQGMVDELGGVLNVKQMNNENMWYNGCYTITTYIYQNEKVFTKNPKYWDSEGSRFDTVTYKMVESNDVAFQLYQAGELDYCVLTEANLKTIYNDKNHKLHNYLVANVPSKYSYQYHFNFDKLNADKTPDVNWNTSIANKDFRLAWYYGLNLIEYYKRFNAINPMVCENNFYTMKGLIYNSKGEDYIDLVRKEMNLAVIDGEKMDRFDAAKFATHKKQAMEDLTKLGVTFPVHVAYFISGSSQTALDNANVLKHAFSSSLGDDFIVLDINTFVSSNRQEVINPKLQSVALNGWGADYGDPQNYLGQETFGFDNAYYSDIYSNINDVLETEATKDLIKAFKDFTALVVAADSINTDLDARYAAYAKAEAVMLQEALVVPNYYNIGWALSKIDNYTRMYAMFGVQNDKMKNWVTNSDGYTTEEDAANFAAKNAGKK